MMRVFLIVLAVLVLAGMVLSYKGRYPGTWRHAFDPDYSENRRDLNAARQKLHRAQEAVEAERSKARTSADTAAREHDRRVREARAHLAHLRDPGRGTLRDSLAGRLNLREHVIEVTTAGTITDYPLRGCAIEDQYSRSQAHVYLTLPDGRRELLTIALDEETTEAQVRAFVVKVHNAIAEEKQDAVRRKSLVPDAEAELRRALADTDGRQQAQQHLEETEARLKKDPKIPRARRELDAAHDRWEQLTGHRPK